MRILEKKPLIASLIRRISKFFCVFVLALHLHGCKNTNPLGSNDTSGSVVKAGDVGGGSTGTSVVPLNVEVPIEMLPLNVGSSSGGTVTYEASRQSFNTSDYDGTKTYYFDIVAKNTGGAAYAVDLVDAAGIPTATISVPSGTAALTRFRAIWTPNSGSDSYRVKLAATGANFQLSVNAARMIVQQTAATKTKIYVPLMIGYQLQGSSAANADVGLSIDNGSTLAYSQFTTYSYAAWKKDATLWGGLASGTPYTFEAVIHNGGISAVYASLFDKTANSQVASSEVSTTNINYSLVSASFADADLTDRHEFEVRLKTTGVDTIRISKAGLWIQLNNMTKGEVYYLVGKASNGDGSQTLQDTRMYLDTSLFSNPSVYFEANCAQLTAGVQTVELDSVSTNDSGLGGQALIVGSAITCAGAYSLQRSAALTVTSTHRFLPKIVYSSGTQKQTHNFVVVGFQ